MSFVKKSSLTKKKSITVINHNVTSNLSSVNNITSDSLMPQKGNYSEMNQMSSKEKKIIAEIEKRAFQTFERVRKA